MAEQESNKGEHTKEGENVLDDLSSRASFDAGGRRHLYGRRRSHSLRPGRAQLMDRLGETWAIPGIERRTEGDPAGSIDPKALFPSAREVWLEIGFGGGEHLAHVAGEHPDVGFLGCEHYVDGVAKMLSRIEGDGLQNVRVHAHDARDLIDALPEGSLGRVYLLYPDPWPKTRHHKRRFMNPANLRALARAMKPGAELRVASDIADYIRHSLVQIVGPQAPCAELFEWTAEKANDWRLPWAGWFSTRYEAKALREGRTPAYLIFRRR